MNDASASPKVPRRSRAVWFVVLAVALVLIHWFVTRRGTSNLPWLEDYDAAVAEAKSRKVPILLDFWASWCAPCQKLDATVFSLPQVEEAASGRYVLMRVDLSNTPPPPANAKIAERYGVATIPSLLVVDAESGRLIARASEADEASGQAFVDFLRRHSHAEAD